MAHTVLKLELYKYYKMYGFIPVIFDKNTMKIAVIKYKTSVNHANDYSGIHFIFQVLK